MILSADSPDSEDLNDQNFLEIYKEELHTRRAIEYQRQKDQESGDSGLDNLINVS